jgi:aspartyl protease family protein
MSGDDTARLIYGVLCAVLVFSALAARRLPMKQTAKMLLAWVAIFAAAIVLFSFRYEMLAVYDRVKIELFGPGKVAYDLHAVVAERHNSGLFFIQADVKSESLWFAVDTGASFTALSKKTAERLGVDVDWSAEPLQMQTANGMAPAWPAKIDRISIGSRISMQNVDIVVQPALDHADLNLLGMTFLSRLDSYAVSGNQMFLVPRKQDRMSIE